MRSTCLHRRLHFGKLRSFFAFQERSAPIDAPVIPPLSDFSSKTAPPSSSPVTSSLPTPTNAPPPLDGPPPLFMPLMGSSRLTTGYGATLPQSQLFGGVGLGAVPVGLGVAAAHSGAPTTPESAVVSPLADGREPPHPLSSMPLSSSSYVPHARYPPSPTNDPTTLPQQRYLYHSHTPPPPQQQQHPMDEETLSSYHALTRTWTDTMNRLQWMERAQLQSDTIRISLLILFFSLLFGVSGQNKMISLGCQLQGLNVVDYDDWLKKSKTGSQQTSYF